MCFYDFILSDIKMKGGGGTDFIKPLSYVEEKYPQTKIVIYLTDGYGTKVSNDYPFKLIWCLCEGGNDELIKDSGIVINLED